MPRYHFNVYDGHAQMDADGTELPSAQVARIEALRLAGQIIGDSAALAGFGESWRVEVTDDAGLVLFCMDFRVADVPAHDNPASRSG